MKTLTIPVWTPEVGLSGAGAGSSARGGWQAGISGGGDSGAGSTTGTRLPLLLATLFALFILSGPLLRLIDPVAAAPDIGVLGLLLLGLMSALAFIAISRWLLGLLWPVFRDFRLYHFEPIFKSLLPWQKILFYLACYFLLLYAFVLCLVAVF